jgi:hypothetical protein
MLFHLCSLMLSRFADMFIANALNMSALQCRGCQTRVDGMGFNYRLASVT